MDRDYLLPQNDSDRRTGRSTRQMKAAPQCAYYIWPCVWCGYAKDLAAKHGRRDLRIRPACWCRGERFQGEKCVDVVFDHAVDTSKLPMESILKVIAQSWL